MPNILRSIAIHLPQFHPFSQNDEWWGKGFTEWTNVTKSLPLYKNHYQPHLPADLGFYDLRLAASRLEQIRLAKSYGIAGFCYYHYWFNGVRLMKEPLDSMLAAKDENFPFMYCWANENWTKRWDGKDHHILIEQKYSTTDDIEHIQYLIKNVFNDTRYIRVNGKPFFIVYRPSLFPNIKDTIKSWRREAEVHGMELYLGYMQGFNVKEDPIKLGFDVAIDFQPNFSLNEAQKQPGIIDKLLSRSGIRKTVLEQHRLMSYRKYVDIIKAQSFPDYNWYPSITPMWDNSARRKSGAYIFTDSTPEIYSEWLAHIYKNFTPKSQEENFVFINAWNEWAEGNHLEPCIKWGRKYLEATKRVIDGGH